MNAPTLHLARRLAPLSHLPLFCLLAAALLAAPACMREGADITYGPEAGGGPSVANPNGDANSIPGDLRDGLVPSEGGNIVAFAPLSALWVTTGTTGAASNVYLFSQRVSCSDWLSGNRNDAKGGLLLQLQLPPGAAAGNYSVVPGNEMSADTPAGGQAWAELLESGTPLLNRATGSFTLANRTAAGLQLRSIDLTWSSGAQMNLAEVSVTACAPSKAPEKPETFTVAAAYFRPATPATATVGALPTIVTLSNTPISCKDLRDGNSTVGNDATFVYLNFNASAPGTLSVVNTNLGTAGSVTTPGVASVRYSTPTSSAIASSGSIMLQSAAATVAGQLQAVFPGDAGTTNVAFTATACP